MIWFKQFKQKSDEEVHKANIETTIGAIYNKITSSSLNKAEFSNHEQFYVLQAVYERLLLTKEREKKELLEKAEDIENALEHFKN